MEPEHKNGGRTQMARGLTVDQVLGGSIPLGHPNLEERVEELEKALKEFGRHKVSCHWLHFDVECDCGLYYAQGRSDQYLLK